MINAIKNILGFGPKTDYIKLMEEGALLIDVRTPGEFGQGHIKGSVNIPLKNLSGQISKIKKDRAVITCCASGMRSAQAKSILISHGYKEVYNGGGWSSL